MDIPHIPSSLFQQLRAFLYWSLSLGLFKPCYLPVGQTISPCHQTACPFRLNNDRPLIYIGSELRLKRNEWDDAPFDYVTANVI